MLEVDRYGFDEVDRKLLLAIIEKYQGGPVGVNTLAAALAEEPMRLKRLRALFDTDWIFEPHPAGEWRRSWRMSILGLRRTGGRVRCFEAALLVLGSSLLF